MAGKPTKARQNGQGIWLYIYIYLYIYILALDTKRGPEGPSIVQGSPAECQRVKLIEVDPALSNHPKYVCTASELD